MLSTLGSNGLEQHAKLNIPTEPITDDDAAATTVKSLAFFLSSCEPAFQ